MLRLGILLAACSLFLSACDDPPEKPTLLLCVVDVEQSECVCAVKIPNQPVAELKHEPMIFCNKAVAFIPDEWEKYKNYVEGLEAWIDRVRKKAKPK